MKIEIFLSLLAALVFAAAAERISNTDQLLDNGNRRHERGVALNELARRRKRYSNYGILRFCCPVIPMSCCQCCRQQSSESPQIGSTPNIKTGTDKVPPTPTGDIHFENTTASPTGPRIIYVVPNNFTIVINSVETWIVIFTSSGPSCSYCPTLQGIIKRTLVLITRYPKIHLAIMYVNYGDHKTFLTGIGVTIYPTIYIYCYDKDHPYNHAIPPTAEILITSTIYLITRPKVAVGTCATESETFPGSSVYELIDSNFQETVESCTEVWVINFYLAWPDVCSNFFSIFEAAARQLKGRVKFGAFYQSTTATTPAQYQAVTKACWVKMFPEGEKGGCVLDFNLGEHTRELDLTLVAWIEKYLDKVTVEGVCGGGSTTPPTTTTTEPPEEDTTTTPYEPQPGPDTTPPEDETTPEYVETTPEYETTTTRRRKSTTTTRKPSTTTKRRSTTTTTRRPTTTTTRRRSTTTRRTTTTRKPSPKTTTTTTLKPPRTTTTAASIFNETVPPGVRPEPLPNVTVNEKWCRYRCCIVYFLPQQTKCELTCYKNYMTTLERVSARQEAGCKLYFEYQGKRFDFERTFAIFQFPRILIVTTFTRTFITRDGTVSEPALDQYIEAYVLGKLQMKRIPIFVPSPCESEAC